MAGGDFLRPFSLLEAAGGDTCGVSSGSPVGKPKQRRRTQVERRAASERKLLVATAELIVERGLNNVSLAEIGRRAGYSHALVNHFFGSKAALMDRLDDLVEERFQARFEETVAERSGAESLSAFVETYLGLVIGGEAVDRLHLVLWAEATTGTPESRRSAVAWDRRYRDAVAGLIATEDTDNSVVDPAGAAFIVVGLLRGAAMQLLIDPAAMSVEEAIDSVNIVIRRFLMVR
jgi:AcrR family transcriptional regulator